MTGRIAKKHAKDFLCGRITYPTYEDFHTLDTDGNYVIKVLYKVPEKVKRNMYKVIGNPCHWDSPLVIGWYDMDGSYEPSSHWKSGAYRFD